MAASKPSRLDKVVTGRLKDPPRVMIYGPEGCGKTTIAACAPRTIFLDIEGGSGQLPARRYSFRDGPGGYIPRTFAEVLDAIEDILYGKHDYLTFAMDTVDRLEALIRAHVCAKFSGKVHPQMNKGGKVINHIEEFGFGKGFDLQLDEFRLLCSKLDEIRLSRGMTIILTSHAQVRPFKNPIGEDFDRYSLRVHEKSAGFLKEWAEVTAFYHFEMSAMSMDGESKAKGASTGKRLLHTDWQAGWDAKARIPMPPEIVVEERDPWGPLARAIAAGQDMTPVDIEREIRSECARLDSAELTSKVVAAIADVKDTATLSRYLNNLRARKAA